MPGITPVPKETRGSRLRWASFPGMAFLCFLVFSIFSVPAVFGRGKAQEEPKEPLNKEWTLCVGAFDVSEMPLDRQFMGGILAKNLVYALSRVDHRERSAPEYAYYEGAAWSKTKTEAAKKLVAKHNERDLLIFKGEPNWKYRKQLAVIDEEIKKLEEEMQKAENESPLIVTEPALLLTESSRSGSFPLPPQKGEEYSFCINQKADALLMGTVFEYHGRINLNLKLYTLYTRSFTYEDTIIFSPEDINSAMTELVNRLAGKISGTPSAMMAIKTDPEDAVIMIQNSFAGVGDTGVLEYSPGKVTVDAFAEDHSVVSSEVELNPGEITELDITLPVTSQEKFDIRIPHNIPEGGALYRGALYIGEPPLSMLVPQNQYEYVHIETPEGRTASAVFNADPDRRGNSITLKPSLIYLPEEKRVEQSRRAFYGAWGRFWIALPLTVLLYGVSTAYAPTKYGYDSSLYLQSSNTLLHNSYISLGAIAITGIFAAEWIYRTFRYISTAGGDAVPMVK